MKKLLILTILLLSQQLHAPHYAVYVMNDTVKPVKVYIEGQANCPETNHGDMLPAKTEDHWPINSGCNASVTFTYPDGKEGKVTAKEGSHHFVITSRVAKDGAGRPIKLSNGEDKIDYNWEDR